MPGALDDRPYVFVSYASVDRERVLPVVERLEAAGVSVWIDREAIHGGANYALEIAEAIEGAAALLLMCSPASLASRNVKQEIALGWRFEKPYLPLLLETIEIPKDVAYWLEASQWIEVLERPASAWMADLGRALDPLGINLDFTEDRAATSRTARARPLLVGREREQVAVRQQLDQMLAGQGGTILVGGEAGIGKTTLVEDLSIQAEEQGALVLWGHAYDLSVTPPYGPWLELLRAYPQRADLPQLPSFVGNLEATAALGSQDQLFAATRAFLQAEAGQQPLLLVLDDLHWFDQASLDFFRYLARQVGHQRILLVATYRSDELHRRHPLYTLLPLLVREAGAERVDVRPLTQTGNRALIQSRYQLADPDEARLERYLEEHAEGNPLYSGELLRTLEEAEALVVSDDGWQLGDLEQVRVPPLLRQVIEGRLARLPEATRELLDVAAIIGQDVPFALWATVAGVDAGTLLEAAEAAVQAAVLVVQADGSGVQFRHALLREALYENVLSLRRRLWHCKTAEALAATHGPDPDQVAYHFQQGGDERAVEWLIRAGERAQRRYAWGAAVARFEAALARLSEHEASLVERATLQFRIGHLQRYVNEREALSHLQEARRLALAGHEAGLATACLQIVAQIQCLLKDLRPGIAAMEQATEEFRALAPEATRRLMELIGLNFGSPEGSLAVWLAGVGRIEEAREHAERMIAESPLPVLEPGQGDSWYADGLLGMAVAASLGGQPEFAREAFKRATAMYAAIGHHDMVVHCCKRRLDECELHYFSDEREARARLVAEGEEAGRRAREANSLINPAGTVEHGLMVLTGNWQRAREVAEIEIRRPHLMTVQQASRWFAQLATRQGDNERAGWMVAEIIPGGPEMEPGAVMIAPALSLQCIAAEMALDTQDLPSARSWLEAHDRWLNWSGAVLGRAEGALLWAQYHHANGDVTRSREFTDKALAHASSPRQPLALIAAHRFLGNLDTTDGAFGTAEEHLQQSLTLADACQAPFERALTLLEIAKLRLAQGRADEARGLLTEVREICEPLGAKPTLDKVATMERELASSGAADA